MTAKEKVLLAQLFASKRNCAMLVERNKEAESKRRAQTALRKLYEPLRHS